MSWDDFANAAEGFEEVTTGLTNIRDMAIEDQDRKKKKAYETDVENNMALLSTSEGDASKVALGGAPKAQADARKLYASDLQTRQSIKDYAKKDQVKGAYKKILSELMENGQSFQQDRGDIPVDIYNEAMNKAVSDYTQTEQGKALLAKTRKVAHDENWATFSKYKTAIQASIQSGDNDTAVSLIERMSFDTPMPYSLQWDQEKGAFNKKYMHSGSGEWEDSGTVSASEAMTMINDTSQRQYAMNEYVFKEATRAWNNDAWLPVGQIGASGQEGKTQIYKKDGKHYYITPQKDPNRPNSVSYFVTDSANNQKAFRSKQELMQNGFRFEDLNREKSVQNLKKGGKELEYMDAKIRTQDATTSAKNKEAGGDPAKAQKYYKELIIEGSKFFNEDSDLAPYDMDGNETKAAENTRMKALSYYDENKGRADSLTGSERRKFFIAKAIAGATDQMFKVPGKERPPIENARRGKDGNWYVPNENGGWSRVREKDGAKSAHGDQSGSVLDDNPNVGQMKSAHSDQKASVTDMQTGYGPEKSAIAPKEEAAPSAFFPGIDDEERVANTVSQEAIAPETAKYGNRPDGTKKGLGFLGEIQNDDGSVSTELSVGVNIDGKETLIPMLIPGLSNKEIKAVTSAKSPKDIPKHIIQKAVKHAKLRISLGKSPFAQAGETEKSAMLGA